MIHINSSKGSSMLNRRPRGMIQTSIIVLLAITVGYVLYLNSSLQVEIGNLDSKTKRYQTQHETLSSQLQVVYEERSRLEASLKKEKTDHHNTKYELDLEQDSHERIQNDLKQDHDQKYGKLLQEHASVKDELERADRLLKDAQDEKKILENHYNIQVQQVNERTQDKEVAESERQELQEKFQKLSDDKNQIESLYHDHSSQLEQAQIDIGKYKQLQSALLEAGSDVLKLDHPHFDSMAKENRLSLFAHVAGNDVGAQQLEEQRAELNSKIGDMSKDNDNIDLSKIRGGSDIAVAANSCLLPVQQGHCADQISRYFYQQDISSCSLFTYTGCGGNKNNFKSLKECEELCRVSIPQKPAFQPGVFPNDAHHKADGEHADHAVQPQFDYGNNPVINDFGKNKIDEKGHVARADVRYPRMENADSQLQENLSPSRKSDFSEDKAEEDPTNPVDLIELKAREEEQRAQDVKKRLLQEGYNAPETNVSEDEAIEKFRNLQEEQQQVAKEQAEDMKKFALQRSDNQNLDEQNEWLEGTIEDEEDVQNEIPSDKNEDMEADFGGEDEDEEQVDQLEPAVKIEEQPLDSKQRQGGGNFFDDNNDLNNRGEEDKDYNTYNDDDEYEEDENEEEKSDEHNDRLNYDNHFEKNDNNEEKEYKFDNLDE